MLKIPRLSWRIPGDRWLWLILLLALGLRVYHIAYPAWDYHNWRQTQTLMVARDFARHGFRILHPQVQWVSWGGPEQPSYFSGEFSVESVGAAALYKVVGESDAAARIVVIAFSLFGTFCLHELLRQFATLPAARAGALVYALLPYSVFFGRVFMPDIPAVSLALGALAFLARWTRDGKRSALIAAALLTASAVLQKLTIVFVGIPLLYLFWLAQGGRFILRREFYVFIGLAAAPCIAWYAHANLLSRESGFVLMQTGLVGKQLTLWLQPSFLYRNIAPLWSEAFSATGLTLAVMGFFWPARNPAFWIFRLWTLGAGLLLFLIPGVLSANHYYYTLLLPGGAALAGLALEHLLQKRNMYAIVGVILAVFVWDAIGTALPLYQDDRAPRDLGLLLRKLSARDDLVITESGGSPNVLYFADRRGWILEQQYDIGLVERLAHAGARYYVDAFSAGEGQRSAFYEAMDARFERLTPAQDAWPVYRLVAASQAQQHAGAEDLHGSRKVRFDDQLELANASVRPFTTSPTTFEVAFSWRRLKRSAAASDAFVEVVDPAEETVYHGALRVVADPKRRQTQPTDERRLVVLPGWLPKARYRITLGWLDRRRNMRLAITGSGIANGTDCAEIGVIEVRRTPQYGWFVAE